jgi:hypothetical protein
MARVNQQIATQQRQLEELGRVREDFSTLEQLLEDNPDLAEQLFQRAGRGGQGGTEAPHGRVDTELTNEVRQLRSMIEQDREASQRSSIQAKEQHEMSQTDQELSTALKKLLAEHDLDEDWLPHARAYVLETARRIPNLEMDEIPYVFAEWARPMHGLLVKQLDKWRTGKFSDQKVMPPAPTGNGAVMAARGEHVGANDRKTAAFLEEQLKARLGWRNE